MSNAKQKVTAVLAQLDLGPRPIQTHVVFFGKYGYQAYQDGDVLRYLLSGEVLARKTKRGWDGRVKQYKSAHTGYDDIVAIPGSLVTGSMWDGIPRGRFF